jgi:hypothetical protein
MNRTVTGIFADRAEADSIHHALLAAGFHPGQVKVLDFDHLGRRSWFERRIASTSRAVVLGAIFGVLGGALAGLQFGLFGSARPRAIQNGVCTDRPFVTDQPPGTASSAASWKNS